LKGADASLVGYYVICGSLRFLVLLLFWSRVSSSILEVAVKLLRAVVQLRGQVVDAIQTFALLDSKTAQNYQFQVNKKAAKSRVRAYLLEGVTVCFICG
jgi:hypothetical protein